MNLINIKRNLKKKTPKKSKRQLIEIKIINNKKKKLMCL